MSNSAYGKLLEDVKKRIDINLVSSQKKFLKLSSKPNFHTLQIINKRLVTVQMIKISVMLNKPIICGFTVLELSKVHMYNFHYNYIRKLYDTNAVLLFTDTDSLCYHIMSDSVYRDILENSKYFVTSNYKQESTIFSERNKILGSFKDEYGGNHITHFVGLRAKMYALKTEVNDSKRAKGLKGTILKNDISFNDYVNAQKVSDLQKYRYSGIRTFKHKIYTTSQKKVWLNPWDDKRYTLSDGTRTLAYGHYQINEH